MKKAKVAGDAAANVRVGPFWLRSGEGRLDSGD